MIGTRADECSLIACIRVGTQEHRRCFTRCMQIVRSQPSYHAMHFVKGTALRDQGRDRNQGQQPSERQLRRDDSNGPSCSDTQPGHGNDDNQSPN